MIKNWLLSIINMKWSIIMLGKVKNTILKYDMLSHSERVLVGLSGGADSVALLVCLNELGYNVSAMHINHNLRGEESCRDERFCIELCKNFGIPLTVKSVDVKGYCRENKLGIEEGARELRYEAFSSAGADKICTAHTLSDSVETMLINLIRGTALKGLCGVPYKRGKIVRPLIECTREEVEEFLSERGISFVTDSTNNSDDYTRNKIRHKIIPQLVDITSNQNGDFYKNVNRTLKSIALDENFLNAETECLIENAHIDRHTYDIDMINSHHKSISNRAYVMLLKRYGVEISQSKLEDLKKACNDGKKINLKNNVYASVKSGKLTFSGTREKIEFYSKEINFKDTNVVIEEFFGRKAEIRLIEKDNKLSNIHNKFTKKDIDYDKIKGRIFLRNRKGGDKIRLSERGITKSIKKLFNENIPLEMREKTMILSDDCGVIYVEGFGADGRVSADENTKRILEVEIS